MTTTTLLRGVVGSTAYGLATPESDIDRLGVFIAPTTEVAGLYWHASQESRGQQGPLGDDFMEHEVGKFLRLALKANPTILELMWLKEYEIETYDGEIITNLRRFVLSHKYVHDAYYGYAEAQRKKLLNRDKPKYAKHILRLLEQGTGLLKNGMLNVKVKDPQRYHDLVDMTPEQRYDAVIEAFRKFPMKSEASVLPALPETETVQNALAYLRKNYI